MSSLLEHARRELRAAGLYERDADYDGAIGESVEALVRVFAAQGYSGGSAAMALGLLEKLLRYEPLSPLTGAEEEWTEVAAGLWQNRRASRVFKEQDGRAYDIQGRVFVEPSGVSYTNGQSRVYVTFPYTPVTRYVRVGGLRGLPWRARMLVARLRARFP